MNSWRISWRNLTRRKLRTFFTFLAISIGVASTLAVTSTVDMTKQTVEQFLNSFNEKANMRIKGTEFTFSDTVLAEVEKTPYVSASLAHLIQPAKLEITSIPAQPNDPEQNAKAVLHGYSSYDSKILDWRVVEGNLQDKGLVLTSNAAKLWGVSVGNQATFEIGGALHTIAVSAIVSANDVLSTPSGWKSSLVSRWHVAVPLELLQEWSGLNGQVREIQINISDGHRPEATVQLESLLKAYPHTYLDPILMSENDLMYGLDDIYSALYMLSILGLLMSAAILFSSLYVSVSERRREFAVMKTLGCTTGQIAWILLQEIALLAFLGTFAGLVLGIGLSFGMTYGFMEMLNDIQEAARPGMSISWKAILLSIAAGVGCTMLAALIPLIDAVRTSVAFNLRQTVQERDSKFGWIAVAAGVILSAIGLWMSDAQRVLPLFAGILLLFPLIMQGMQFLLSPVLRLFFQFEGTVAATGIRRQLRRTSITAGIVCIGLAFLLAIGSIRIAMEQSVEKSARSMVGGDLIVNTTTPITAEDLRRAREVEGVAGATLNKETSVVWKDEKGSRKLLMSGVQEPSNESIPTFTSKDETIHSIIEKLKEPHTVALGHAVYKGWGKNIGDMITFNTPNGVHTLKVVAVVYSIRDNGDVVFVSEDRIGSEFGVKNSTRLDVLAQSGVSSQVLLERMEELFKERLSGFRSLDDYMQNRREDLLIPFAMMNVLLGLIVIISSVGVLNTLMMNVFERTREIGTMRAIASTRWQIRKIVLGEGFIIGVTSAIVGIILGLSFSYSMAEGNVIAGMPLSFQISWGQIGLVTGFGIVVSLGSAWLPAALASRVPLSEALRYE
nr:ABC transporter permease [Paenibacillus sp. NEAU-GSW1]